MVEEIEACTDSQLQVSELIKSAGDKWMEKWTYGQVPWRMENWIN